MSINDFKVPRFMTKIFFLFLIIICKNRFNTKIQFLLGQAGWCSVIRQYLGVVWRLSSYFTFNLHVWKQNTKYWVHIRRNSYNDHCTKLMISSLEELMSVIVVRCFSTETSHVRVTGACSQRSAIRFSRCWEPHRVATFVQASAVWYMPAKHFILPCLMTTEVNTFEWIRDHETHMGTFCMNINIVFCLQKSVNKALEACAFYYTRFYFFRKIQPLILKQ